MMFDPQISDLIRVSHAARLLGVSEAMIRVLADNNRLPCLRVQSLRWFNRGDVMRLRDERLAGSAR